VNLPRRKLLHSISAAFFGAVFGKTGAQDQGPAETPRPQPNPSRTVPIDGVRATPYDPIEKAASAMKDGDADSVRAVVEAVFKFPHVFPLPEIMADVLKQRLMDAEIAYVSGKTTGVEESSVVEALNYLATTFETPDYARVSLLQVQLVRSNLHFFMPIFMHAAPAAQVGEGNPPMSPLQSTMVMSSLISSKLLMADYQLPPAEWDRDAYPRLLEEERARQEFWRRIATGEAGARFQLTGQPSALRVELMNLLRRRILAMSVADGLKLFNETFARLGIK
jgi:hypothetical protein